jgi:hypothetical protein
MGLYRFVVPAPDGDGVPSHWERAYLAGQDGMPVWTRVELRAGAIEAVTDEVESARLYIPWHVTGAGEWILSTTSLMSRERPYFLPLELARGALSRAKRAQAALQQWEIDPPETTFSRLREASRAFTNAVTFQSSEESLWRFSK